MFFIFQVPHSAMPEQERVRQCEMARARRARFDACHGRLPAEGEDRDREREDEDREPREGKEEEVCEVPFQEWELVEDPARPPVALPQGKYKLLNNRNKLIPVMSFKIFFT